MQWANRRLASPVDPSPLDGFVGPWVVVVAEPMLATPGDTAPLPHAAATKLATVNASASEVTFTVRRHRHACPGFKLTDID
jgi:hypothetical protein